MTCHVCQKPTDEFECEQCNLPTCEDCLVPYDQFTMIDYCWCTDCHESNQANDYLERSKEWKRKEDLKKKREHRNKLARARYWKPENVAKRKEAKKQREIERAERDKKIIEAQVKSISKIMKGFGF